MWIVSLTNPNKTFNQMVNLGGFSGSYRAGGGIQFHARRIGANCFVDVVDVCVVPPVISPCSTEIVDGDDIGDWGVPFSSPSSFCSFPDVLLSPSMLGGWSSEE